jgi:hypothetical protein
MSTIKTWQERLPVPASEASSFEQVIAAMSAWGLELSAALEKAKVERNAAPVQVGDCNTCIYETRAFTSEPCVTCSRLRDYTYNYVPKKPV